MIRFLFDVPAGNPYGSSAHLDLGLSVDQPNVSCIDTHVCFSILFQENSCQAFLVCSDSDNARIARVIGAMTM